MEDDFNTNLTLQMKNVAFEFFETYVSVGHCLGNVYFSFLLDILWVSYKIADPVYLMEWYVDFGISKELLHTFRLCRPCYYTNKDGGCRHGTSCYFCHDCTD